MKRNGPPPPPLPGRVRAKLEPASGTQRYTEILIVSEVLSEGRWQPRRTFSIRMHDAARLAAELAAISADEIDRRREAAIRFHEARDAAAE